MSTGVASQGRSLPKSGSHVRALASPRLVRSSSLDVHGSGPRDIPKREGTDQLEVRNAAMGPNLRAELCVGAAIIHRGSLLLLRRATSIPFPGLWELPGGHVERGESLQQALLREVREETRLSVRVGQPFYAWSYAYPGRRGGKVPTVEIDFHCALTSERVPRLDPEEHVEFVWVRRRDLSKYPTDARLYAIHRRAFEGRS